MYGSYKPQITGQDEGIWRRINIIPFIVSIPEKYIQSQSVMLRRFKEEKTGIFAWIVRGCLEWQQHGLGVPARVIEANSEYRHEEDVVQHFIDECCENAPSGQVNKTELYQQFRTWCAFTGNKFFEQKSQKWFTQQLTLHGYLQQGHGRQLIGGLVFRGKV